MRVSSMGCWLAFGAFCWFGAAGQLAAEPLDAQPPDALAQNGVSAWRAAAVGPGEVVVLDWSEDPTDADSTGVTVWNRSSAGGNVEIDFISDPPPGAMPMGFELIDGSLLVRTDLPPGSYRMLVRRKYDGAQLRRKMIRENSLRVLRRKKIEMRRKDYYEWRIARPRSVSLRKMGRKTVPAAALRARTEGLLGQYGFDPNQKCVWTVVDQASYFAAGGQVIPEPATLGLLLGGASAGAALALWRRGRSKAGARCG